MPPVTQSPNPSGIEYKQFLAELTTIQKSMFDQAANYTKLVLGLGYAGFFAAWSGTKANLRPAELVGSALLICLSLFAYIIFEIYQGHFNSKAAIDLARTIGAPGLATSALTEYRERTGKALRRYAMYWTVVFFFCAGTGTAGALILIQAFLRSLWRMAGWHL